MYLITYLTKPISSISEKIKEFNDTRGFLFNIVDNNTEYILESCKDLHIKLSDQTDCDLNGIGLCNKIMTVQDHKLDVNEIGGFEIKEKYLNL